MAAKDTEEKKSEDQEADLSLDMSQSAVKKKLIVPGNSIFNVKPYSFLQHDV